MLYRLRTPNVASSMRCGSARFAEERVYQMSKRNNGPESCKCAAGNDREPNPPVRRNKLEHSRLWIPGY